MPPCYLVVSDALSASVALSASIDLSASVALSASIDLNASVALNVYLIRMHFLIVAFQMVARLLRGRCRNRNPTVVFRHVVCVYGQADGSALRQ